MSILWTDSNDAHARPLLTAHCLPQLFATTVCHNCLFTYCLFTYCCSPIVVPLLLCTRQVPGAMAYAPTRPTHVCTPKFSTTFALSDLDLIQLRSAETPGPGLYYGEKWCWTWTTVQLYLYSRSTVLTPLDLFRCLSTSFGFFRLLSTSFDFFRLLSMSFDFFRFLSVSFDFFRLLSMSFDFFRFQAAVVVCPQTKPFKRGAMHRNLRRGTTLPNWN
jgi:hypothetical protein